MVGFAQAHPGGLAVGGDDQAHGCDVGFAHAGQVEGQCVFHFQGGGVDDADAGPQLVAHPQLFAVGAHGKAAGALAGLDDGHLFARAQVDHMHGVGHLGGDVGGFAIGGYQHAFGLAAGFHAEQALFAGHVVGSQLVVFFNRHVHGFAIGAEGKNFGAFASRQGVGHLAAGHVYHAQLVAVAAGHQHFAAGLMQQHVARALAHGDGGFQAAIGGQHGELVVFFAADQQGLGGCGGR